MSFAILFAGRSADSEERATVSWHGGNILAVTGHLVGQGRRDVQLLGLLPSPDPQVRSSYRNATLHASSLEPTPCISKCGGRSNVGKFEHSVSSLLFAFYSTAQCSATQDSTAQNVLVPAL